MFSKRCHLHQSLGVSSSLEFCIQFCIHFYNYKHAHQKPIGMCLICFLVTKSPWRRKGFIWLSDPCHVHVMSTSRPRHGPSLREELKQRSHRSIDDWLGPHGSLCFLTQCRTICPGIALPTIDWVLHHQLLNKKMLPKDLPAGQSEGAILRFPLLCFCQAVKKRVIDTLSTWHTNMSLLNHNLPCVVYPQDLKLLTQYNTHTHTYTTL